jgi:SsrA-binding protein
MARTEKVVTENRKAFHDYFIDEVVEAGMVLSGTEVKSIRLGRVNLRDSYVRIEAGQAYLFNCHIAPYDKGNRWNHEPYRDRKLLLHKQQIRELLAKTRETGYTLIPIRMYFDSKGRAKLQVAVARGKKVFDKRQSIRERDAQRQIDRVLKARR